MAKKYYWLKLQRDFFKRHDIRIIESMPNGKDYLLFYLKLLCESIDHNGNLRFSDQIPYNEDMLATITNTNVDIVRSAITVFTQLNMMELLDDGTFYMSEVEKMIGSETEWAEKKKRQRALPKLVNGSVRINGEMLKLPDGSTRIIDEKRFGGNGMYVYDRANGQCEVCGSNENVVIHHNNGYSNEPQDLICLCSKCHGIVHSSKYGGHFPPHVLLMSDKSKSIEKDIDIDKDIDIIPPIIPPKGEKKKTNRFVPPTIDEISEYCRERKNNVNPEKFFDFYESKGWMVGKNKMKDWKAAVRTWERGDNKSASLKSTPVSNIMEYEIDNGDTHPQIPPYYGFPKEWFDGDDPVRDRFVKVKQVRNFDIGVTDDTIYSPDELWDKFILRKRGYEYEQQFGFNDCP